MSKMKSLFAAGIVTSVVVIALVGLNMYNHRMAAQAAAADATAEAAASNVAYVEALTARQGQLDEAVVAMEARGDGYGDQVETANQTVDELEASIAEMEASLEANNEKIVEYEPQLVALNNTAWSLSQTRNELAAKEAEYTAQIEAANEIIVALQTQIGQ